jgi:hypothetical protein
MKAPVLVLVASCALFAACNRAESPTNGAMNPTNNSPGTSESYTPAANSAGEVGSPASPGAVTIPPDNTGVNNGMGAGAANGTGTGATGTGTGTSGTGPGNAGTGGNTAGSNAGTNAVGTAGANDTENGNGFNNNTPTGTGKGGVGTPQR